MLKITKTFKDDGTLSINSSDSFGVEFRTSLNNEEAAIFTLPELLELMNFLQLIRPLIQEELKERGI
jgi:hypothetical protein